MEEYFPFTPFLCAFTSFYVDHGVFYALKGVLGRLTPFLVGYHPLLRPSYPSKEFYALLGVTYLLYAL